MKANELRVGNLVFRANAWDAITKEPLMFSDWPYCVDSINSLQIGIYDFPDFDGCFDVPIKDISPIPLTEEWLLKADFEKEIYNEYTDIYNKFPLQLFWNTANSFEYFHKQFGGKFIKIQYVHQLQNLYFALTGEELNFKL